MLSHDLEEIDFGDLVDIEKNKKLNVRNPPSAASRNRKEAGRARGFDVAAKIKLAGTHDSGSEFADMDVLRSYEV
jgi:hypothetical protein